MKHFFIFTSVLLLLLGTSSCVNEELEIDPIESSQLIEEESELFLFLSQITEAESEPTSVTCIDFLYSFRVFVYDELDQFVSASVVSDDLGFYGFLIGVPDGYSVGISFPISATLDDGSEFIIENKDQLAQAISVCITAIQAPLLMGASNNFSNPQCGWEVRALEGNTPDMWERSVFEVSDTGNLVFYDEGIGSAGTWIFYYIGNQLHLNIFLNSTYESVPETWNKDWIVTFEEDNQIILTNEDLEYSLNRICEPDIYCTTLFFRECEDPANPDVALFNFSEYSYCIGIITNQLEEDGYLFTYFETLEDAEANTNALPQTNYTNIINAQTIYVRITNPDDNTWNITDITILADFCG